jgi:hypothetical protein
MKIAFVPPELRRLDQLRCDVLALSFFEEERPLRGAAGLVDWRLCGKLSRLLASRRLAGTQGEVTLLPPRPRLPFDKLLLLGLGARGAFDETAYAEALRRTFGALSAMRTHSVALALPGRATGAIGAERAMTCLLEVSAAAEDQDELVLIEDVESQKAMAPLAARR